MSSLIRTIVEPQTVYIMGCCGWRDSGKSYDRVGLTDDESTIDFYAGDKEIAHLVCFDGAFYIFNSQEMKDYKDTLISDEAYGHQGGLLDNTMKPDTSEYIDKCGIILRNFSGDISISIIDKATGRCYLNHFDHNKHDYIVDCNDEPWRELDDYDERVILPPGTVAEKVHLYEIVDDLNGGQLYKNAPSITTEEEIYQSIVEFDKYNYQSFDRAFAGHRIYKPAFMGYLLGRGFKDIANKRMRIYKDGGEIVDGKNSGRSVYFSDFIKDFKDNDIDPWRIVAQYISSADIYIERFNELFYKPSLRPLDQGVEPENEIVDES